MLHWTPETRALVRPLRNRPEFPVPEIPSAKECWKSFASKRRGLSTWEKDRLEKALAAGKDRFYGTPTEADPILDSAILQGLLTGWHEELTNRWALWVIAAFGAGYFLERLADAIRAGVKVHAGMALQESLRQAFARADDATYAAAAASVKDLFGHSPDVADYLVYVLPDPPADHAAAVALHTEPLPWVFGCAAYNPAVFARLQPTVQQNTSLALTYLAQAGEVAVPFLISNVEADLAAANKWGRPENVLRALAISDDPRVAKVMVDALAYVSAIPVARGWILQYPQYGLPLLAEATSEGALTLTKELMRTEADQFRAILPSLSAEAQKRLAPMLARSQSVSEAAPEELPAPLRANGTPPAWVRMEELPEVLLAGGKKVLASGAAATLAALLAAGQGRGVQGALESTSFTAFLNALLNCWMKVDSKDKSIVTQVGLLVDEPGARLFMKRVEGWASSSGGFHLAMAGLRGLALRGDNGLRLVHRMSLKAKSQGLRKNAAYALNAAASERKLSRVELEDRLVPDLDLGADGGTWLDFGSRRFRVGFDENLKPTVRDEAGKLLKDLPKPNQSDDAEKSAEATERWKQLKKEVRELAPLQIARLEDAMGTDRRWAEDAFFDCFVRHPLMQHLARRLLWGTWKDKTCTLFRIAEDGSFSDVDEQPFALPSGQPVGIVHPLYLSPEQAARWGQIFSDYEILQPFQQLSRPVFRLSPEEVVSKELVRFSGLKTMGGRMLGISGKPNWQKGGAVDNGVIEDVRRTVPGGWVDVWFSPGVGIMGGYGTDEVQSLKKVELKGTSWSALPPVVVSEVLREIEALRA